MICSNIGGLSYKYMSIYLSIFKEIYGMNDQNAHGSFLGQAN